MKECFDDKTIRQNMRDAISEFCKLLIRQEKCSGYCECCPVNDVYDMARERESKF